MTTPVTIKDGKIFWRSVYRSKVEAENLRDFFRSEAAREDWFQPLAQAYADDIDHALEATKDYPG